jgi:hypothetical protein
MLNFVWLVVLIFPKSILSILHVDAINYESSFISLSVCEIYIQMKNVFVFIFYKYVYTNQTRTHRVIKKERKLI